MEPDGTRWSQISGSISMALMVTNSVGKVTHEYTLFKGFAAYLPQGHLTTLSTHPAVDEVENDQQVHTQ